MTRLHDSIPETNALAVNDNDFAHRLGNRLEQSLPLPANLQSRLRQAREKALNEAEAIPRWMVFEFWKPIVSFASVAVIAVAVTYFSNTNQQLKAPTGEADVDLLFTDQELEFYQNLEFYSWLAVNEGDQ